MILQNTISAKPGSRKRPAKRVGRGQGSGHGTYASRGIKGQHSRSGSSKKPGFEGGQTPLIRRMPKIKGFKSPNKVLYQAVNIKALEIFEDGATVDFESLTQKKLINRKNRPVKVLGDGEITKKLSVRVHASSKSAKEKIEKAGGTVEIL